MSFFTYRTYETIRIVDRLVSYFHKYDHARIEPSKQIYWGRGRTVITDEWSSLFLGYKSNNTLPWPTAQTHGHKRNAQGECTRCTSNKCNLVFHQDFYGKKYIFCFYIILRISYLHMSLYINNVIKYYIYTCLYIM